MASTMTTTVQSEGQELALHEAAVVLDAVDDVQRPAGRAERAGRAVERDEDADDEREGHRAARLGDRALQRRLDRVGHRRVGAVVARVVHRVGDEALGADQPEDGHHRQQRGEQRHHRVVRQRRRVVGHLVRLEALERPLQDAGQRRALAGHPVVGGHLLGVARACGMVPRARRVSVGVAATWQQRMPLDDRRGDVHDLATPVARVVAQHREGGAVVDRRGAP